MDNTTLESTLELLAQRKGEWRKISNKTGLDYSWLTKFAQGKIKNPGFQKIQTLSAYLKAA